MVFREATGRCGARVARVSSDGRVVMMDRVPPFCIGGVVPIINQPHLNKQLCVAIYPSVGLIAQIHQILETTKFLTTSCCNSKTRQRLEPKYSFLIGRQGTLILFLCSRN